jgi:hypothetical protein
MHLVELILAALCLWSSYFWLRAFTRQPTLRSLPESHIAQVEQVWLPSLTRLHLIIGVLLLFASLGCLYLRSYLGACVTFLLSLNAIVFRRVNSRWLVARCSSNRFRPGRLTTLALAIVCAFCGVLLFLAGMGLH